MDSDNFFLPYEIISDETNDNNFINQYSGYVSTEDEEKQRTKKYNEEEIYVGTDIDKVVNNFKNKKKVYFKKLNNNNLIFNNSRSKKNYKENFTLEDDESEDSEDEYENTLKDNSLIFTFSNKNLEMYFYCLIIGIIFIFLIFIISKLL